MSTDEPELKRIYVGGLSEQVTEVDICNRFMSFGGVKSVELVRDASSGFGYLNIEIKPSQWKKCTHLFNGSRWKGSVLKVELAKPDYLASDSRHADDMSLVTEKNIEGRKHWKRGRYGRPVRVMRMVNDKGEMVTIDPTKYKDNLVKLFGSVASKPSYRLCWAWDDIIKVKEAEKFADISDSEGYSEDEQGEDGSAHERCGQDVAVGPDEETLQAQRRQEEINRQKDLLSHLLGEDKHTKIMTNVASQAVNYEGSDAMAAHSSKKGAKQFKEAESRLAAGVFDSDADSDGDDKEQFASRGADECLSSEREINIAVGSSLKDIFSGDTASQGFQLFGSGLTECSGSGGILGSSAYAGSSVSERYPSLAPSSSTGSKLTEDNKWPPLSQGSALLFFFHRDDSRLAARGPLSNPRERVFLRTEPLEEIEERWKEVKSQRAREFKRIHKSVSKKVQKMKRRRGQPQLGTATKRAALAH
ncbi:hypothetical protein EV182_002260 [Spiromyces aspiralis]|uniref:Uncharacterized protein n=1 Tax=Spiromyces aspiralis TaxID=68401 RepID=A0ACC1HHU8_9FUNG|nr:hypothetical protein EV182_002260 [Spiromyces aspiralis]